MGIRNIYLKDTRTGSVKVVSASAAGIPGNRDSDWPVVTPDGRYVAFSSRAFNLVPGDNRGSDVFLKDTRSGAITLVSMSSEGEHGNNTSFCQPSISDDGRHVAFDSFASNLVPGDTNGMPDVFLKDTRTGDLSRISTAADGTQGDWGSNDPSLSADGRLVAFTSVAGNLVPGDTNNRRDVFLKNVRTGAIQLLARAPDGTPGEYESEDASLSANGRYVAFTSYASLGLGDPKFSGRIFLKDLFTGRLALLSTTAGGRVGDDSSMGPFLSRTGRFVAFISAASNLVPGDTNHAMDVYLAAPGLTNGGMEADADGKHLPDGWEAVNWASRDRRVTNIRHRGAASVKLSGNGELKMVQQTIVQSGVIGERLVLTAYAQASQVPRSACFRMQLKVYAGGRLLVTRKVDFPGGTHDFVPGTIEWISPSPYTKLVVSLQYRAPGGSVRFDDVSLSARPRLSGTGPKK